MVGKLIAAITIDLSNAASISYTDSSGAQVHVFSEVGEAVWFYGATLTAWLKFTDGDVVGPASATDNALPRFDGETGKLIQNSGVLINDDDEVSGVATLTMDEQSVVEAPGAGKGMFWVADDSPTTPSFVDDSDTSHTLAYAADIPEVPIEAEVGIKFAPGSTIDDLDLRISHWSDRAVIHLYDPGDVTDVIAGVVTSTITLTTTTGTGANTLDTGSLAVGGYYIYAISDDDASTIALIMSTTDDPASVTLPGGYTRVSRALFFIRVENASTGDIVLFESFGWNSEGCRYSPRQQVLSGGTATGTNVISLTGYAPTFAGLALIHGSALNLSSTQRTIAFKENTTNTIWSAGLSTVAGNEGGERESFTVGLLNGLSGSLAYGWSASGSNGASAYVEGWVRGDP